MVIKRCACAEKYGDEAYYVRRNGANSYSCGRVFVIAVYTYAVCARVWILVRRQGRRRNAYGVNNDGRRQPNERMRFLTRTLNSYIMVSDTLVTYMRARVKTWRR